MENKNKEIMNKIKSECYECGGHMINDGTCYICTSCYCKFV